MKTISVLLYATALICSDIKLSAQSVPETIESTCPGPLLQPDDGPALAGCTRTSDAYKSKYRYPGFYIPGDDDDVITIKISINIFQDLNGQNNFPDVYDIPNSSLDKDWILNRFYKGLCYAYEHSGIVYDFQGNLRIGPSDPIPGVPFISDTKIRFDIGESGHERIYFYKTDKYNRDDLSVYRQIVSNDPNRIDPLDREINIYFCEGTYNNTPVAVGGYVQSIPNFNFSTIQDIMLFRTYQNLSGIAYDPSYIPDFAGTVSHEMAHALGLLHTYISGTGGGNNTCDLSSFEYLDDIYGTPPNNENWKCPHLGTFNSTPYTSQTDRITNNRLGATSSSCYFSPKQIGWMHRDLTLKSVRKYLKEYTVRSTPLIISTDEEWDFDVQLYSGIILDPNTALSVTCNLSLPDHAEIFVPSGSTLTINGVLTNNFSDAWQGTIRIENGGKLILGPKADVRLKKDSKIYIDETAKVSYAKGSKILLKDLQTLLEIKGELTIADNANFTFTGSGYMRTAFPRVNCNPASNYECQNHIKAGANASFTLTGSGRSDKILEVAAGTTMGNYGTSFKQVKFGKGLIQLESGARINISDPLTTGELDVLGDGTNAADATAGGFILFGQANIQISNTKFSGCASAITNLGLFGEGSPNINLCEFYNNTWAITTVSNGLTVRNSTMRGNLRGIVASQANQTITLSGTTITDYPTALKVLDYQTTPDAYGDRGAIVINALPQIAVNAHTIEISGYPTGIHLRDNAVLYLKCSKIIRNTIDNLNDYIAELFPQMANGVGILMGSGATVDLSSGANRGGFNSFYIPSPNQNGNPTDGTNNRINIAAYMPMANTSNLVLDGGQNNLSYPRRATTPTTTPDANMAVFGQFEAAVLVETATNNLWDNDNPSATPIWGSDYKLFYENPLVRGTYWRTTLFDLSPQARACGSAPPCLLCPIKLPACLLCGLINTPSFILTPINRAIETAINTIITNPLLATGLFKEILTFPITNPTKETQQQLETAYRNALEALEKVYEDANTQVSQRTTAANNLLAIVDYRLQLIGNNANKRIDRFNKTIDKAGIYRMKGQLNQAVGVVQSAYAWANNNQIAQLNYWDCILNAEIVIRSGPQTPDAMIELQACRANTANAARMAASEEESTPTDATTIDVSGKIKQHKKTNSVGMAFLSSVQVNVIPNPNTGTFRITFNYMKPAAISINDIAGRMVYSNNDIQNGFVEVDLSEKGMGVYFIKTTIDGQTYNNKVVVQ